MPLDLTSPADTDFISLGAGEIRGLKSDMQDFLSQQQTRKPNLIWIDTTTVDVENNSETLNETIIPFPDGEVLSVVEDTSSANKYRRFLITVPAEFTSGTEDSGLRSGITEATNTFYAIYAVKSTIDATKFVLVGDTTLPTQANAATLDSRYGANSYVFLGLIRNGDNSTHTADILSFIQVGNQTHLTNKSTGAIGTGQLGLLLANDAGVNALTYTRTSGVGTTDIPNNITVAKYWGAADTGATAANYQDAAGNLLYAGFTSGSSSVSVMASAALGLLVSTGGTNTAKSITLQGWIDSAIA